MASSTIKLGSCIVALLMLGGILTQSTDELLNRANATLNNQDTINKTLIQGEKLLEAKCKNNSGDNWENVFNEIKEAKARLEQCGRNFLDVPELKEKMAIARPKGKLDEVFRDYCNVSNRGVVQECFKDFTKSMEPCLEPEERKNVAVVHNVTEQLANFICHRDGDRIALFIAEKGEECLTNHTEQIRNCVRNASNTDTDIDLNNVNMADLASFNLKFEPQTCHQWDAMKLCVVRELTDCEEPTPANIAEALFKFIRKALPCGQPAGPINNARTSGASSVKAALATFMSVLTVVAFI